MALSCTVFEILALAYELLSYVTLKCMTFNNILNVIKLRFVT